MQNDPVNLVDPTGLMLSDIGVYQTTNERVARGLEYQLVLNLRQMSSQSQQQGNAAGGVAGLGAAAREAGSSHSDGKEKDYLGDAVKGSTGVGRPFYVTPQGSAGHDGTHALSGPNGGDAITLPSLTGRVIYWNEQEKDNSTKKMLYTVRVQPDVGDYIIVYKDLDTVSSTITRNLRMGVSYLDDMKSNVRLNKGDKFGTVRPYAKSDPMNRSGYGLHVTFVLSQYYQQFANSTKRDNSATLGSLNPSYFFIDPCSASSPVRCR